MFLRGLYSCFWQCYCAGPSWRSLPILENAIHCATLVPHLSARPRLSTPLQLMRKAPPTVARPFRPEPYCRFA